MVKTKIVLNKTETKLFSCIYEVIMLIGLKEGAAKEDEEEVIEEL